MITKNQILNLEVGDVIPNMFGNLKKVTRILHKGTDINGKMFVYFYQEFGNGSEMSSTLKEGNQI